MNGRKVLSFVEGVSAQPVDGQVRLEHPSSGANATIGAAVFGPLLLLDGQTSSEEMERRLAGDGIELPPGVLERILAQLRHAGLLEDVETEWKPLVPMAWPEHKCQGCGACCQGHWIPISDEFAQLTMPRLDALRRDYPRLADRKPFVRIIAGDPQLYLNSETGECVFLDDDRLCILHKEFGMEGKPSACQLFPHVRFEDRQQTRLGVGLMCLTHHDQTLAQDANAEPSHWEEVHASIDGSLFHHFDNTEQEVLEVALLERLSDVTDPLGELLDATAPSDSRPYDRRDNQRLLERQARACLVRIAKDLREEPVILALIQRKGDYPQRMSQFLDLAEHCQKTPKKQMLLLDPSRRKDSDITRLLRDALQRFLFLRQYRMFFGLQHASATLSLGVWMALVQTERREGWASEFGRHLATWMRVLQSPEVRRGVFESPQDVDRFLTCFRRFWA
ncbi:MAG: YkgJ family cysteine cluster protein [Myxococcales bacterium]|nr:YkgJ family cysteine cluster protein [Myxococcales bacterium]